jgi:thiosulfate/3-mercaptopyruvate sulfurtransferase
MEQITEPLISSDELADQLWTGDCVIVDCRFDLMRPLAGREAYARGHIPGAYYAHLDDDLAAPASASAGGRHPLPDPELFAGLLGQWGLTSKTLLIAYDASAGAIAARLWWLVRWMGHRRVAVLDGGWPAWQRAGLPIDTDTPEFASTRFVGQPGSMPVVDADGVAARLDASNLLLIDARAPPRFAGLEEPLDPVAGHIPGAINLPFSDNLAADGRFRTADALARMYEELMGDQPAAATACMCGSGVTACHTLLAMDAAGISGAALYAGSWSDWISDSRRPVARE